MEDLLEQANEIQETLGRSYAVPDEIDEADLQAGAYARSLIVVLILIFFFQSLMRWSWRLRKKALRT